MKRFLFKIILFICPFLISIGIEVFILPIDYFTFRVWEAIVVKKFYNILSGPFYPNMELRKFEEGDLAHHTKFGIRKKVTWYTDRYGYRKKDSGEEFWPIVIVGDSNIAGSGLDQKDILSEVLEKNLNLNVYPMAPAGMNKFLKDRRFINKPPRIVIFEAVEREIPYLSPIKYKKKFKIGSVISGKIMGLKENRLLQDIVVYLDRMYKTNMLNYFRANIRRIFARSGEFSPKYVDPDFGPIFFLNEQFGNQEIDEKILDKAKEIIKGYDEAIKSRGIRFIFLPIPEKENIFYKVLGNKKPLFLKKLIESLKESGIEVIDTQTAFEESFLKNRELLYQIDDTHWNENGVRLAARLIENHLKHKGLIYEK